MNTHNMVHQFTHLHGAWRSVSNESKAGKSWMSEILIAIGLGVHRPGIVGLRLTSQKRFPKNTASSFEKWCSCPWKGQKHMKNVGLEDCSLPFSMPQCGTCSFRLQGCSWKMFGKVFFPKEFTQDQSSQGRRRFPETAAFWFPRWSYCLEGLQCSSRNFGVKAQSDTPQGGRTVDGSENRPTSNRFILPFTGLYIYIPDFAHCQQVSSWLAKSIGGWLYQWHLFISLLILLFVYSNTISSHPFLCPSRSSQEVGNDTWMYWESFWAPMEVPCVWKWWLGPASVTLSEK